MRKKKQRENVNIVEKKQRMKRMKVQKEKKEKKANGELDSDGDIKMEEAPKKPKVKGAEIAKIKSKRSADITNDEPKLKKKKKTAASDEKDMFFLKPEDSPVEKKKVKVVKAAPATKLDSAPAPETSSTVVVKEKVAKQVAPALSKAQTKAQTGVVGVVDKTKKIKPTNKNTTDIVAALESESKKKQENTTTGTGLDVGGWD